MPSESPDFLLYQRAAFTTRLPVAFRYHPAHFWLAPEPGGQWRIGFTKFATRMLGEMVDHHFDPAPGAPVTPGQGIGWIEGFKALTELFCIASGEFAGENPLLSSDLSLVSRDPYGEGWLYRVRGEPDPVCVDVEGYRAILETTLDRILDNSCRP